MAPIPLILVIIFNFFVAFYLLNRYGNLARHNILVTICVFISWFFSFNVIFILPLDITSTIYNQCVFQANSTIIDNSTLTNTTHINETISNECVMPWSYISKDILLTLWQFIYWSSQILTWILLPIFQSYSMSGEFTRLRKIKSSLIENLKYYCFFGVLFLLFLIYYTSTQKVSFEGLKVFCVSASNTFGLFLLVILLGYGLVEIPRSCFLNYYCNYQHRLNYLYFKVGKLGDEKYNSECHLEDLFDEIRAYYNMASREVVYQPYMTRLNIICAKCPDSFRNEVLSGHFNESSSLEVELSEQKLVKLNARVKKALQTSHRTQVQYKFIVQEAIELKRTIETLAKSYPLQLSDLSPTERWLCQKIPKFTYVLEHKSILHKRIVYLLFGYIFAIFSILIIWSEFTFFIKPLPISVFALIIKLLQFDYLWIEVFSMLAIAYLSTCCYYTIFKIRIFNYYYLAKHQQTDEYSLIFCGMYLCRLASPICLNFLSMIHLDSHILHQSIVEETCFTQIMGHMDTISFISDKIFIYLPVFMSVFCVATFWKLDSKIASLLGFEQYSIFDEVTQDYVSDGEKLVKREEQKQTRSVQLDRPQPVQISRPTSQDHLIDPPPPGVDSRAYGINQRLFDDI